MGLYDDDDYLHVVHKDTNEIKIVDKRIVEVVESRVNNKTKSSGSGRVVNIKDSDPDRETYDKNRPEPTKAIRAIDKNITSELYHEDGEIAMKLQNDFKKIENNTVLISGTMTSDFVFSHEVFGEAFYTVIVSVERISSANDAIPVIVSERLVDVSKSGIGESVCVYGSFRSYNKHDDNHNRLILGVFANEFNFISKEEKNDTNNIHLGGYVCKPTIYRKTPTGREIADLLIAVNRPYGKSDYIPCICWGRNARYVGGLKVGERIEVHGRIQSRVYTKRLPDGSSEERTAYEVSVSTLEVIEE